MIPAATCARERLSLRLQAGWWLVVGGGGGRGIGLGIRDSQSADSEGS